MKKLIISSITILFIVLQTTASGFCPSEKDSCVTGNENAIYTPLPKPLPRINGPLVYGCRPGHPFLYRIPCQGDRPILFSVKGLPAGLQLDPQTGIIRGTTPSEGEYNVLIQAVNSKGKDKRAFKIVVGDKLALTPTMGWNDWYAHYRRITDQKMREAADILVSSGMADVGYQYVNIDDCWANAEKERDSLRVGPFRDNHGNILPNKHFPDMKGLTDYIHSKGLKAGIYTSPGPKTCAGYAGSYQHEAQDAKQFSEWGFDFLKYDWCSYRSVTGPNPSLAEMKQPYALMGDLLKQQKRDMLFNLCQYGMGNVWEWGAEVGGQSWRTAGDLGYKLDSIFQIAVKNAGHTSWQKPGAWNDPDYIQIGWIGNARGGQLPKPCPLTPNEQYTFMSVWCMMAAPLFYSGDLTKLDAFTLNVLCNPEVIEVDQDPLGECGLVIKKNADCFLMVKNLVDGSKAVGLFNRGKSAAEVTVNWQELQLSGSQAVRDLWRQKALGKFKDKFTAAVPAQGVVMVKINKR